MGTPRAGYTLIELLVVLLLMGLAVALVLPALRPPRRDESQLNSLLGQARAAAAARGERIYLRIAPTGEWRMEGGGSPLEGDVGRGRIESSVTGPVTFILSPLGSCALDARSAASAPGLRLDPLVCNISEH